MKFNKRRDVYKMSRTEEIFSDFEKVVDNIKSEHPFIVDMEIFKGQLEITNTDLKGYRRHYAENTR